MNRILKKAIKRPETFTKILKKIDPEALEKIGEKKALYQFHKAAESILAYKRFLKKKNINHKDIKTINDLTTKVPLSNKDNYVKKAREIRHLAFDDKLNRADLLVKSSGFTGHSFIWIRSREEEELAKRYATIGLRSLYHTHEHSTLIINMFPLGSWASGVDFLKVADGQCSIINPGLQIDEALQIFKDLHNQFDQFLFGGTPSALKNLVERGTSKRIKWQKHRVNFLIGGEAITEEWRTYMYDKIKASPFSNSNGFIYSGFGSSDLGVVGINETLSSVMIRRACMVEKGLKEALFGKIKVLPMLFQYDPTSFYIHRNKRKMIDFTNCHLESITPLIRYDLKDLGGVIRYNEMRDILGSFNLDNNIELPFPFFYYIGRKAGVVNFCGSLIYPDHIMKALYSNKSLLKLSTTEFKIETKFDKNRNEILVIHNRLKPGIKPNKMMQKMFEAKILKSLNTHVTDFREDYAAIQKQFKKKDIVKVKLYKHEQYPFHKGIKIDYC